MIKKETIEAHTVKVRRPAILGTIGRNRDGHFEQIHTPIDFHLESMLTLIYNPEGIYIVLGLLGTHEPILAQLLEDIESVRISHSTGLLREVA